MCRRWIIACMVLLLFYKSYSQANMPFSPISALLHTKEPVSINWRENAFSIGDTSYNRFPQELLKTKDGLFLTVNGSGRLYKLQESDTGIQLQRIDSTFYAGYNHGAFSFVYHDSIYSLGGYGIWRINGQLRMYIPEAHSWDIVPLNEEIPVLMQEEGHNMLWYNEEHAKLYIGYSMVRNQAVKHSTLNEASFDYTVRCLDLKTKDWQITGALNDYFKDKAALLRNLAFTPWGQLVAFGDKLLLIDYANNRLLRMEEEAENRIRPILFKDPEANLHYCIDSTIYFGNISKQTLASLPLHINDFTDAGITVYTKPLSLTAKAAWIAGVPALLLLCIAIWKRKKQRTMVKHTAPASNNTTAIKIDEGTTPGQGEMVTGIHSTRQNSPFDEKELQLIQLILSNNRKFAPTAIEDVNAVLGLTKKSIDTQKNQRSAVLKSINSKYSQWQNTSEKLIESKQVEADKRSRVYYIAPDKEEFIAKVVRLDA